MSSNVNRGGLTEEAARRLGVQARTSTFKERAWVSPSRTLYITNIAPGTTTLELESLFKDMDGFIALRRVRSMCFVDFEQKQQATAAMWKTNGHKFKPDHGGLMVSYDKDDNEEKGGWSMRKREEDRQKKLEVDSTRVLYRCAACNHFCFKLARPLTEMPERKTDRSRVLNCSVDLVALTCVKGGSKLLQRAKGVEKQFRYNCELCDTCVGYRSVPYDQETQYIYIFPEAVSDGPRPKGEAQAVLDGPRATTGEAALDGAGANTSDPATEGASAEASEAAQDVAGCKGSEAAPEGEKAKGSEAQAVSDGPEAKGGEAQAAPEGPGAKGDEAQAVSDGTRTKDSEAAQEAATAVPDAEAGSKRKGSA